MKRNDSIYRRFRTYLWGKNLGNDDGYTRAPRLLIIQKRARSKCFFLFYYFVSFRNRLSILHHADLMSGFRVKYLVIGIEREKLRGSCAIITVHGVNRLTRFSASTRRRLQPTSRRRTWHRLRPYSFTRCEPSLGDFLFCDYGDLLISTIV